MSTHNFDFDPQALEETIRGAIADALAHAPFVREEIPLTPEQPDLSVALNGPVYVRGEEGQTARIRGVGTAEHTGNAWKLNGTISLSVPLFTHLHVQRVAGPAAITRLKAGAVTIETASGPLRVAETRTLHAKDLHGPLSLHAITGKIHAGHIHGPVSVSEAPLRLQLDDVHGMVHITCNHPASKHFTIHASRSVIIQVPAHTALQGTITSRGNIQVATDEQAQTGTASLTLTAAAPSEALTVEIEAGGQVYIGPNPPPNDESSTAWLWLSKLASLWKGASKSSDEAAPGPAGEAAAAAPDDDVQTARRRVLQLLADGKITAEEAEQLLQALQK